MTYIKSDKLKQEILDLSPWFHNLHLPDGSQTAPDHFLGDFPSYKWQQVAPFIPENLNGWSVLDIGCNAGFYSFELARRGGRVVGIDCDPRYLRQARWAAKLYGLEERLEFRLMQVYELAGTDELFDLVLFMGVFYHLRYPMLALDIVASKTARMMILQTMMMPGREIAGQPDFQINEREALLQPAWPKMAFIEKCFAGDPTNWWVVNHAGIEAMLRSAGFKITGYPGDEVYRCEPDLDSPSCVTTWNREEYQAAIHAGDGSRRGRGASGE